MQCSLWQKMSSYSQTACLSSKWPWPRAPTPAHTLTESQQHTDSHQDEESQQGHQQPDDWVPAPTLALHHTLASHGCLTDHPPETHTFTRCQSFSLGFPKSCAVCEHASKCCKLPIGRHFSTTTKQSLLFVLVQSSLIIVLDCFLCGSLQLLLLCCSRYW